MTYFSLFINKAPGSRKAEFSLQSSQELALRVRLPKAESYISWSHSPYSKAESYFSLLHSPWITYICQKILLRTTRWFLQTRRSRQLSGNHEEDSKTPPRLNQLGRFHCPFVRLAALRKRHRLTFSYRFPICAALRYRQS